MKCPNPIHNQTFDNKKSLSNHLRWEKGLMKSESYLGINKGYKNNQWKGNRVKLSALHEWVNKNIHIPKICSNCGTNKFIDLANISQKYKRDFSDWEYLCRKCHMLKDGRLEALHQSYV